MNTCKHCNDTGWAPYKKDGKEFVKDCVCKKQQLRNKIIPRKFQNQWDPAGYDKNWLQIIDFFLKAKTEAVSTLMLWGLTGRGKTRLAYKALDTWATNYGSFKDVEFIKTTELHRNLYLALRGGFDVEINQAKIEDIKSAKFLVIDDFWCSPETKSTDFIKKFNDLFDQLKAEKIVVTINLNPKDYIDVDTTLSRIKENAMILEMKGNDRRKEYEVKEI
jgi:DNA replication protein DnaC